MKDATGEDRVNLLLIEPDELRHDNTAHITGVRAHHVHEVLRARHGDEVRIGVVDGPVGTGIVCGSDAQSMTFECRLGTRIPSRPRVDVLLALPRPKVLRRLYAQLAALGVGRLLLTNAERVERHYFDTHVLTPECYRPLLIEGLQQARDTRVPIVSIHRQFKILLQDHLDDLAPATLRLVAHPADRPSISERLADAGTDRVLLAIGPEGGWNDYELGLLGARGFHPVSMGLRTLRTDTACIALLALTHAALRDTPGAVRSSDLQESLSAHPS